MKKEEKKSDIKQQQQHSVEKDENKLQEVNKEIVHPVFVLYMICVAASKCKLMRRK